MVRRFTSSGLVVLGLVLLAGCGEQSLGSLVVGIRYAGGAWPAAGGQLSAGRVVIFDERDRPVRVLHVKAGRTATAELPPGHYRLGEKRRGSCKPKRATVTGNRTTKSTLSLGCWPSTPRGVLASINAAALAQKSVHATESFAADLYGTDHSTFDVGPNSGSEVLTYYGHSMRVRLVDHTVYIRGDSWLLGGTMYTGGLKLTQAQAKRYANKWISIPKGDKEYAGWARSLTLDAVVGAWPAGSNPASNFWYPDGPLTLSKRQSQGRRLLVLRQASKDKNFPPIDELRARADGIPLPVSYSNYLAMEVFDDGTYSRWNEPVHVHAPARSTPIADVRR